MQAHLHGSLQIAQTSYKNFADLKDDNVAIIIVKSIVDYVAAGSTMIYIPHY